MMSLSQTIAFAIGIMVLLLLLHKPILYAYIKMKVKLNYSGTFSVIQNEKGFDVDYAFYEAVKQKCEKMGMEKCGSFVESNHPQLFITAYLEPEGRYTLGCYSVKNPANMVDLDGVYTNVIDMGSEKKSGDFIETTNAFLAQFIGISPRIKREFFKSDTSLEQLVIRHRERIASEQELISLDSLDAVIASATRANEIAAEFRKTKSPSIMTSEIDGLQRNLEEKLKKKNEAESGGIDLH
jgi:hypothetical protein